MGWIELLRLFAEDQNRASAEANQEAIQTLSKSFIKYIQMMAIIDLLQFICIIGLSVVLLKTYKTHLKKIKNLENSLKSFSENIR